MEKWILTNQGDNTWTETFEYTNGPWTIRKKCLRAGLSQGVDLLSVSNGAIELDLVPTRGMNVWQGRAAGVRLGWDSPVNGPVHPAFVALDERNGIGWTRGFDEWIARCGLAWMGAPSHDTLTDPFGNASKVLFPLHGRISNLPAHYVEVAFDRDSEQLSVYGIVDETAFHGDKLRLHSRLTLESRSAGFVIEDTIENIGGVDQEYQLLYHANFGPPLLAAGTRLEGAFISSEPRDSFAKAGLAQMLEYGPPAPGAIEQVYYHELAADAAGNQKVSLVNPANALRVDISARQAELPFFTQWKNLAAEADGYVTGLEFGSGYPSGRQAECSAGRFRALAPGERETARLRVEVSTE